MAKTLDELVDKYCDQERLSRFEGEGGLKNLCKLFGALGYKDKFYYIHFGEANLGNLIEFFVDNPGAQQAVVDWIRDANVKDWANNLEEELEQEPEEEEDEDE